MMAHKSTFKVLVYSKIFCKYSLLFVLLVNSRLHHNKTHSYKSVAHAKQHRKEAFYDSRLFNVYELVSLFSTVWGEKSKVNVRPVGDSLGCFSVFQTDTKKVLPGLQTLRFPQLSVIRSNTWQFRNGFIASPLVLQNFQLHRNCMDSWLHHFCLSFFMN